MNFMKTVKSICKIARLLAILSLIASCGVTGGNLSVPKTLATSPNGKLAIQVSNGKQDVFSQTELSLERLDIKNAAPAAARGYLESLTRYDSTRNTNNVPSGQSTIN